MLKRSCFQVQNALAARFYLLYLRNYLPVVGLDIAQSQRPILCFYPEPGVKTLLLHVAAGGGSPSYDGIFCIALAITGWSFAANIGIGARACIYSSARRYQISVISWPLPVHRTSTYHELPEAVEATPN